MPFTLRRPAPVIGLDREAYRPGDPVRVTVTLPVSERTRHVRGHARLRCHRPPDAFADALVDPPEVATCGPDCVEVARAELSPAGPASGGGLQLVAVLHLPPDAEPSCRGTREVAAWEVVAVVDRRAASAWVEVLPL